MKATYKLPINVMYDKIYGGPARVIDSNGKTIKVFKTNFGEARKLAARLNNKPE